VRQERHDRGNQFDDGLASRAERGLFCRDFFRKIANVTKCILCFRRLAFLSRPGYFVEELFKKGCEIG
jgi:hypothetical protein